MLLRILTTLVISAVLVSCALTAPLSTGTPQPTSAPNYSDLVITLERTACFGTCPVYKLTVYGDGRAEYEGEMFVAVEGRQTATISAEQVRELAAAIEKANYFSLKGDYSALATDLPSAITTVTLDGQTKTINHYGMCGYPDIDTAPEELCDLENKIDKIANSAQWVGK